jgi:glycerate 2-kinase
VLYSITAEVEKRLDTPEMLPTQQALIQDALAIWQAGVDAVRGDRLVEKSITIVDGILIVDDQSLCNLRGIDRVLVIGGGKASSAMASGLESVWNRLGPKRIKLSGWINVPNGSFDPTGNTDGKHLIHRHAAREPGSNEPTAAGVFGSDQMLALAKSAGSRDLVLCLMSGGASALMPSPAEGLSLEEKLEVTRYLSRNGANIEQLNEVRRCLSKIKGGGLARACCNANKLITLVISDVLGDPLPIIGSGPTILEPPPSPSKALSILDALDPSGSLSPGIRRLLRHSMSNEGSAKNANQCPAQNIVLANNATAVDAAGVEAVKRGYAYWMQSSPRSEGDVLKVADELSRAWFLAAESAPPDCLISGGEPTVQLPDKSICGLGGRNQQLALALLLRCSLHRDPEIRNLDDIVAVCGGTDGEDGPTTAAGAVIHAGIMERSIALGLDIVDYLHRCDAYHFFQATGGLVKTGPTHTNVCDLRVALVRRR